MTRKRTQNKQAQAIKATAYDMPYGSWLGGGGLTGESKTDIRPDKYGSAAIVALNVAAQRCVQYVGSEVGSTKWTIKDDNDQVLADSDQRNPINPLAAAIKATETRRAEDQDNLFTKWSQALAVAGECYIELLTSGRDFRGTPSGIDWLNPLAVLPQVMNNQIERYQYNGGDRFVSLRPEQVAYSRFSHDLRTDIYGHPPLASGSLEAGVIINSARAMQALFRNGGMPGVIASPKEGASLPSIPLGQEDPIVKAIREQHKGVDKWYRMAWLRTPIDIQALEHPDIQKWAETFKTMEASIYTAFGLPRPEAGDTDSTRYQTSPTDRPRAMATVRRYLKKIEQTFNARIAPFFDGAGSWRLEFDYSAFQYIAPETVDSAQKRLSAGIITLNEARLETGQTPIPTGDVFFIPSGVIITPMSAIMPPQPAPNPVQPALPSPAQTAVTTPFDTTKDVTPLTLGVSLAGSSELKGLVNELASYLGDDGCEWLPDDEWQFSLLNFDADEIAMPTLSAAIQEFEYPEIGIRLGSINWSAGVGKDTLYFRIRRSDTLDDLKADLEDLAVSFGAKTTPQDSILNIGYKPRAKRVTYRGKKPIVCKGVYLDYGGQRVWQSWNDTPSPDTPLDVQAAQKELLAYRKLADKKADSFVFDALPPEMVNLLKTRISLKAKPDENVFDVTSDLYAALWHEYPKSIKTALDTDGALPDFLAQAVPAVKAVGVDPAMLWGMYRGVLLAKALSDTRSRFEAALTKEFLRAWNEKVKRSVFIKNMTLTLDRYCRQAYKDAYADLEIVVDWNDETDEDVVAMETHVRTWVNDQRDNYVTQIADVLYADDEITEDEIKGQKGELWWNKSVYPVYAHALTSAGQNVRLEWVYGDTINHCHSCETLNGIVLTAKRWASEGVAPKQSDLECGGWGCDCSLKITKRKKFRGKLPNWRSIKSHDHGHETMNNAIATAWDMANAQTQP